VSYANVILSGARRRAKERGLKIDLDRQWVIDKIKSGCQISGLQFRFEKTISVGTGNAHPYYPTVDKINPSKGYTKDNCRIVCWFVNRAKGTMSDSEFIACANLIAYMNPMPFEDVKKELRRSFLTYMSK
jgi:hypothetical protein